MVHSVLHPSYAQQMVADNWFHTVQPGTAAADMLQLCCYCVARCVCSYSAADLSGKAACKRALQREMRLEPDPDIPLIGFIGRLDYQKGPDLVLDGLPALSNLDCQVRYTCAQRLCWGTDKWS